MSRLLAHPQGFDLFQALNLLERAAPDRARLGTSQGLDEAVDLRADPSLSFASSDIASVTRSDESDAKFRPPFQLVSAVLSLAGAQGPLPVAFTELLLEQQRRRDDSGLAFLDIFNRRTLSFLYRSRIKHRLALQSGHPGASAVVGLIDALSGLGLAAGARGPQGEWPWMRHAALQAAAPRSMASLQALLADGMGLKVQGHSLTGAWITLPAHERAVLGRPKGATAQALRLGINGSLGLKAWDQSAAIGCQVEPQDRPTLESLLPGQPAHRRMAWLIQRHLQSRLRVEVQVPLKLGGLRQCRLSGPGASAPEAQARLGTTAWLGGQFASPAPGNAPSRPRADASVQATRFLLRT